MCLYRLKEVPDMSGEKSLEGYKLVLPNGPLGLMTSIREEPIFVGEQFRPLDELPRILTTFGAGGLPSFDDDQSIYCAGYHLYTTKEDAELRAELEYDFLNSADQRGIIPKALKVYYKPENVVAFGTELFEDLKEYDVVVVNRYVVPEDEYQSVLDSFYRRNHVQR